MAQIIDIPSQPRQQLSMVDKVQMNAFHLATNKKHPKI